MTLTVDSAIYLVLIALGAAVLIVIVDSVIIHYLLPEVSF